MTRVVAFAARGGGSHTLSAKTGTMRGAAHPYGWARSGAGAG